MLFEGTDRRQLEKLKKSEGLLPPGQSLTLKWPVLHYGSVPRFDPETWDLRITGLVGFASKADLERVQRASENPAHQRFSLRHPMEPLRQSLGRRRVPRSSWPASIPNRRRNTFWFTPSRASPRMFRWPTSTAKRYCSRRIMTASRSPPSTAIPCGSSSRICMPGSL